MDLDILRDHVRTLVTAQELCGRRNVAGIDFGLRCVERGPSLPEAEKWLQRFTGVSHVEGAMLFWPKEYGRVVIVYEDGRLAYDPGAAFEDETETESLRG